MFIVRSGVGGIIRGKRNDAKEEQCLYICTMNGLEYNVDLFTIILKSSLGIKLLTLKRI